MAAKTRRGLAASQRRLAASAHQLSRRGLAANRWRGHGCKLTFRGLDDDLEIGIAAWRRELSGVKVVAGRLVALGAVVVEGERDGAVVGQLHRRGERKARVQRAGFFEHAGLQGDGLTRAIDALVAKDMHKQRGSADGERFELRRRRGFDPNLPETIGRVLHLITIVPSWDSLLCMSFCMRYCT